MIHPGRLHRGRRRLQHKRRTPIAVVMKKIRADFRTRHVTLRMPSSESRFTRFGAWLFSGHASSPLLFAAAHVALAPFARDINPRRCPDARHRPCSFRRGGAEVSSGTNGQQPARASRPAPSSTEGARNAGRPIASAASCANLSLDTRDSVTTKAPDHPAFRTRWFFRLASRSPRRRLIRFVRHRRD
jgi:hypothetical protein